MFGHHPATVRLAGRKRHARFESSEALAELPAVARTAVKLHGCCARVSLAAALLSQHIDGVARAGSAGTKSGLSARSLVLTPAHHVGARRREPHGSGTSYSSATKRTRKSPTAIRWAAELATVQRSAICQLPASARSLRKRLEQTPPVHPRTKSRFWGERAFQASPSPLNPPRAHILRIARPFFVDLMGPVRDREAASCI
jgi:hypothetical protein